jgi:hypothetical protein
MALWTCRCAWTTQERCPHAHSSRRRRLSSRDLRLTTRLRRCQKPDSQNASRPGRHQIATVGEIISESWARSNRYTWARSSESAAEIVAPLAQQRCRIAMAGSVEPSDCFVFRYRHHVIPHASSRSSMRARKQTGHGGFAAHVSRDVRIYLELAPNICYQQPMH